MNTTKKLTILCLIAVMALTAVMPSTFSWFNHSDALQGDSLRYQRNDLDISVGSVTMKTQKIVMAGNDILYDAKGNKSTDGVDITSDNNLPDKVNHEVYTKYYQTTFTNTSETADAYVNFYLTNYKNIPNMYIGTIYPIITEKDQAGQASASYKAPDTFRVYFQDKAVTGWASKNKYVCYTTDGSTWSNAPSDVDPAPTAMTEATLKDGDNNTWYYDIPVNTKSFYFYAEEQKTKPGDGWYRTTEVNTLQAKTGYYIDGSKSGYNHPTLRSYTNDKYISVSKYYDKLTISANQKIKMGLPESWYTGKSVSYQVTGSNVVFNQTNEVLRATANLTGTVTLTTTITGALDDTKSFTTTLSTPEYIDSVPVILNMMVPKATRDIKGNKVDGTKVVEWYIRNEGNVTGSFEGTFFTK